MNCNQVVSIKEKKWLAKSSPIAPQVTPHPYHHTQPHILPDKGSSFDRGPAHVWSCLFCAVLPLHPQRRYLLGHRDLLSLPGPTRQVCQNSSALSTAPQRGEGGTSSPHLPPDSETMNRAMLWPGACHQRAGTTASCRAAWGDARCITQEQGHHL